MPAWSLAEQAPSDRLKYILWVPGGILVALLLVGLAGQAIFLLAALLLLAPMLWIVRQRRSRGAVLLDMGAGYGRGLVFLCVAFAVLPTVVLVLADEPLVRFGSLLLIAAWVSCGAAVLTDRFVATEHGLWLGGLIRWQDIDAYQWRDAGDRWQLRVRSRSYPVFRTVTLTVAPRHVEPLKSLVESHAVGEG